MSLDIKGQKCAVCHSYFFEDDDVVYCPTCGAPHHRSCYNSIGKCGLEELHGTENQYDIKKVQSEQEKSEPKNRSEEGECAFCHAKFESDAKVCPYCGKPRINFGLQMDFLGGIDPEQDVGGVTAKEARDFVVVNTHRYIPKFASGRKTSWNWMAFLFPQAWYLSRRMYKLGAIILTLLVVATIFTLPAVEFINTHLPNEYTRQEFIQYLQQSLPDIGWVPMLLLMASGIINVLVRLFSGLFGDYWYKKYVITKITQRKDSKLGKEEYNQKYGGVNLLLAAVGLMIMSYLPSLLSIFVL
ncbi:MAG: DUF2628 domain-containing protein [Clostridia bacterium]|nr:DUF2628 domain-containing protein [Clostridia bacterium]MBQ7107417.1 DUF2628 domain-containing protein [Clostridia bacterium]